MTNAKKDITPQAIYQVVNYYAGTHDRDLTPTLAGSYTSEERAVEIAELEWAENGNWHSRLAVPYPLYKRHIDHFETIVVDDWREYTDFHDYRGYTKEEWKEAEELVNEYKYHRHHQSKQFKCTVVCRCTLDSPTHNSEQVWEKCENKDRLIPCEENGKWGFRDKATGKYVIQPAYIDCTQLKVQRVYYDEGETRLFRISEQPEEIDCWRVKSDNGKWGVIDEDGETIIPAGYDEICDTVIDEERERNFVLLKRYNFVFKVSDNGKYGLLRIKYRYDKCRSTLEIPVEYDGVQYNIDRESSIAYATVCKNGRQENIIVYDSDRTSDTIFPYRQRLLDSWFEWTEDAVQRILRLNTMFLEAETNANQEYAARKAELKLRLDKGDNLLTDYEIRKMLNLAIFVEDDNGKPVKPTEGIIYAQLNNAIANESTGFLIDGTQDWAETLDPDVAGKIYNAIPDDLDDSFKLHYAFHVLHSHLYLAWEDILKIRSVGAEVKVVYQKNAMTINN